MYNSMEKFAIFFTNFRKWNSFNMASSHIEKSFKSLFLVILRIMAYSKWKSQIQPVRKLEHCEKVISEIHGVTTLSAN